MPTLARPVLSLAAVLALTGNPTPADNKLAAQRDAERLLRLVALPPGAQRLASEPSGDGGVLGGPCTSPMSPKVIDSSRFWQVDESLDSVIAFVQAHPPNGSRWAGSCSASGSSTPGTETLFFQFTAKPGRISHRYLLVKMTPLASGATGVRADAQEIWIVPRPPTEVVPRAVREIDGSIQVTNRAKVARIVRWFNCLPTVQPGFISCRAQLMPAMTATLDFRKANGNLLAEARFTTYAPDFSLVSDQCDPISFNINGRQQTALIGGRFLPRVQRLGRRDFVELVAPPARKSFRNTGPSEHPLYGSAPAEPPSTSTRIASGDWWSACMAKPSCPLLHVCSSPQWGQAISVTDNTAAWKAPGGTSPTSTGLPVFGHTSCTIAMPPNLRVSGGHPATLAEATA
jgi:hypothetical protein